MWCALLCALAAVPLAWLYARLTFHNPLVPANPMLTGGFAVALGTLGMLVARYGKVRHPLKMARLGAALGLFGWYCQWAAWLAAASGGGAAAAGMLWFAAHPLAMARTAWRLSEAGIWTLFGHVLPGPLLLLVWLAELLILASVPRLMSQVRARAPFCEATGRWAERISLPKKFSFVEDGPLLLASLEHNPDAMLDVLPPWPGHMGRHASLCLYRCASGEAYVSITNEELTLTDGKVRWRDTRVADFLRLSEAGADLLVLMCGKPSPAQADDEAAPDPPELELAIAHLNEDAFAQAIEQARPHTRSDKLLCRSDANRICALACSRLGQWEAAFGHWHALFLDEPSANTAVQLATSSVMAGSVARGETWLLKAGDINNDTGEMPAVALQTNFIDALGDSGRAREALPYLDGVKRLYERMHVTDPRFLQSRRIPYFLAFLEHSAPILGATLSTEQAHDWYASMLPHIDQDGKAALCRWLAQGMRAPPAASAAGASGDGPPSGA
ncbi:hypothetical protein C7C56_008490 [Massilia glaciei]|uniref:Uncharacterized protein n=1 Tax=Massilia glaciei TaxID=1524097 RepID=A0A2U2HNR4_9BURK|nr:hypothetical protein C7C56_008490 [Massilia glaciei]